MLRYEPTCMAQFMLALPLHEISFNETDNKSFLHTHVLIYPKLIYTVLLVRVSRDLRITE